MKLNHYLIGFLFLFISQVDSLRAQSASQAMGLQDCVTFALERQPALQAIRMDIEAASLNDRIARSGWLPQLSISGNVQHYFQLPVSIFPDFQEPQSGETREVEVGTVNNSTVGANLMQVIYNPEVMRAKRLSEPRLEQVRLEIRRQEIEVKTQVSRAFYRALLEQERLKLLQADIDRLERNLVDAKLLFENGLKDKVDYKRATIALNNAKTNRTNARINSRTQLVNLKQLMGMDTAARIQLQFDSTVLSSLLLQDSLIDLSPQQRIEIRQLLVSKQLQSVETEYQRMAWLPKLSAMFNYNLNWQDNDVFELYNRSFPNSFAAINLSFPIIQGGRRFHQQELSELREAQLEVEQRALEDQISREYLTAANNYQVSRNSFLQARENLELAKEIYQVIRLQYREGIKPYLEVVIAENDFRNAQQMVLNQMISAMISRVELQRASGTL